MKITSKDRARLSQHLTGWNHLNELFVMDAITPDDLCKMIVIESQENQRKRILTRLVGRLYSMLRKQTNQSINVCLKSTLNRKSESGAVQTVSSGTNSPVLQSVEFLIELPLLQEVKLVSLKSNVRAANQRRSSAKKSSH